MQFWPVISLEYPGVSQGTIESPTEKCWSRNSWIFFLLAFSGIGLNHCTLIRDFVFLQGCVYVIRYEHWAWIPSFIKAKAFSLHTNNGKIFILLAHSYHFFPWKQKDGGGCSKSGRKSQTNPSLMNFREKDRQFWQCTIGMLRITQTVKCAMKLNRHSIDMPCHQAGNNIRNTLEDRSWPQ